MSDAELRRRQREAADPCDPGAAARHLTARVRAGSLAPERLVVAAALGDAAARLALGLGLRLEAVRVERVDDLVHALAPVHLAAAVRAIALAVGRLAPVEPDPISAGRLEAARAWCDCPCARHAGEAQRLVTVPEFALGLRGPFVEAALRAAEAAALAGSGAPALNFLGVALRPIREGAAAGDHDEARLAAAVRADLLAWALSP